MAATAVNTDRLPTAAIEARRNLLVSLSRLMAITYCGIGAVNAVLWLAHPSYTDVVNILSMAVLVGISLASAWVAKSDRLDLAAYLQIGGLVVVVTVASAVCGWVIDGSREAVALGLLGISMSANYTVAVVLAGLLLRRREVLGLTVVVLAIYAIHALVSMNGAGAFGGAVDKDLIQSSVTALLGLIVLLSVLASEYSSRLGSTLAELDFRAKEVERHAQELEQVKAEIDQRVTELDTAREELENQRELGSGIAVEIRDMAKELASTSNEQASGSSEQAAAMGEIVATMEELSRAASQIAGNSAQVSQLSASALPA
ncbi:MAG TPA: methyl-accepting chemotaxis protein, partial [Chloroflexota bacterium]|nr:methyl-accepting chemotaxis protein [Chloroflexota bacterium]